MFIKLENRALIKISGTDAEKFLQAQLSNDIGLIDKKNVQLSAYCQHQGKILVLFWVVRLNKSFFLSFPWDLIDKIISRLQMFVLASDVIIENVSDQYYQIGLIDENHPKAYSIRKNLSLLIEPNNKNFEITSSLDKWTKACIDSKIPEVFFSSSEKFVPQMLNLDINEVGVNFSKGCYPGQEVVARLHYLGEAKRRLFAFQCDSEVEIGDNLYCTSSKAAKARGDRYKGSGMIVNKVKSHSKFYCLATLDVELIDEKITINNEHGPTLKRINNE